MRPIICSSLTALALSVAGPAAAHDFWLQPVRYQAAPSASLPFTLEVGHGPFRQRSPIPPDRIIRLTATAPDGAVSDARTDLHIGAETDGAVRMGAAPGVYVVVLETDERAESHLPAIRFNDYLKAEGLTPALEARRRAGRTDTDGSEAYSRRSKALVRVGSGDLIRSAATRPIGLPLEITPEVDPYAAPRPARLPVRVEYEGRRLAGALVKLTDLDHDAAPMETHLTDGAGRAVFAMPGPGRWLLNVIWTKPLPRTRAVDFETMFSSLSFGLER